MRASGKIGQYWGEGVEFSLEDFEAPGRIGSRVLDELAEAA
jgi:hypothetical protein